MKAPFDDTLHGIRTAALNGPSSVTLTLDDNFVVRVSQLVRQQIEDSFYQGEDYLTTEAVADYLRCPRKRIDNLCSSKRIPFKKIGNRRVFTRREVDEWVRRLDGTSVTDALQMAL